MTISFGEIWLYVAAQFILVLSPGPVVAALIARVLSRGFKASIPIALAVFVGDMIWVSIAIFGVSALIMSHEHVLTVIRMGGAVYLFYLGVHEIRHARDPIEKIELSRASGFWSNFIAGLIIIMTNPKAALFYMVLVPQFFNMSTMNPMDIGIIVLLSGLVPFIGNMIWAATAQIAAKQISSEKGRARLRIISGVSLIIVALFLVFVH